MQYADDAIGSCLSAHFTNGEKERKIASMKTVNKVMPDTEAHPSQEREIVAGSAFKCIKWRVIDVMIMMIGYYYYLVTEFCLENYLIA